MKNFRKMLALLLALAMVFSLAACGGNNKPAETSKDQKPAETGKEEKPAEAAKPGEDITLTYFLHGKGKDQAQVEEKVNARLAELNAGYKVKFIMNSWGEYEQKLPLAARGAGDYFDIATTASWLGNYAGLANEGSFLDITELAKEKAPKLYGTLSENQIKGATVNGKLYGIPTTVSGASMARDHFVWSIEELANIGKTPEDVQKIRTVEELEPLLKEWKEKYPDKYPLDGGSEWAVRRVDNLIKTKEDGSAVIENIFEADYMKKALDTIKAYKDAKYIHQEAGVENSTFKQEEPGTWLVKRAEGEPGANALWSIGWKTPVVAVPTAEDIYISNANVQGKLTSIYAHTKYPDQAMNFIELIATDDVIQNLLAWGIEGTHYKLEDGRAIETPEKAEGWNTWQAQFVTDAKRLPNKDQLKQDDPKFKEEVEKFNAEIKPAADLGFTPSPELVEQLGQIFKVKNDYYKDLNRGRNEKQNEFYEKLKAANIDDVLAKLQQEYDAWKK